MTEKKKHVNDVIDTLVNSVAEILEYRAGLAMGKEPPDGHENFNSDEQIRIMKLATPLIQGAQQSRVLDSTSSSEIIKMMAKGEIPITEAVTLIKLIKDQVSMEEKELIGNLQKMLLE